MERVRRTNRLDAGLRGWIIKTARRHYWRVPNWYDLDDLIQDGYVNYGVCTHRYAHIINARHFMALVKVCYLNHIHNLANSKTKYRTAIREIPLPTQEHDESFNQCRLPHVEEEATFNCLMRQLPLDLEKLINVLQTESRYVPYRRNADNTRESINEYLCRILELDSKSVNLLSVFKEHFEVA